MAKAAPNKGPTKATPEAKAPPASPFAKRLANMKKAWADKKEEAKATGGGGVNVPPDFYICRLTDGTIREAGSNDELHMVLQFTVLEGEQTGEQIPLWDNIQNPERLVYAMRDLRRLNVDTDEMDITDIEEVLKQLIESAPVVRLKVAQNGEYTNVYINKVIEDYEGAGETAPEAEQVAEPEAEPEAEAEQEAEPEAEATGEEIEIGSEVTYQIKDAKTKKMVAAQGLVTKIDGDMFSIKNMKTKAIDKVDKDVAQVELVPATE